ncbi:hypothetical protein ACERK3_12345 [Phycisphaerales bacterium AB-hyl4]|uniref:Uncharacterized protein n=1 Tax=Natronomicrosphaera hydrolytica TaxID=3242702 RepID=A0ABV4U7W2_9BACT
MSPACNMMVAAVLLLGIMAGPSAGLLHASDNDSSAAPRLDRAHARQAHRIVEQWVEQGEVPDTIDATVAVTGLSGVRVTLWRDGMSYGAGEAYVDDLAAVTDDTGPAIDLVPIVAEAARQALAGVQDTLTEAQLRAQMDGLDLAETQAPAGLVDLAGDLLVSVQLGGQLDRIRLHDEAAINELYANFAPGAHGLRVTAGSDGRRAAVIWPATVIERNMSPRGQLTHLLSATGHDPTAISRLARPGGPRLARFETLHVVRPKPGWGVEDMVRGAVLLPEQQVDEATLDDIIDRLSKHLARRFTSEGLVRGRYLPTSNRYDPVVADPAEAALAAYALTRYAGYLHDLGDEDRAAAQQARADLAINRLGEWLLGGADEAEPGEAMAAASLTLLSLVDTPGRTGAQREMRDALGRWLVERVADDGQRDDLAVADDAADDQAEQAKPDGAALALTTAALAGLWEQQRDAALGEVVSRLLDEQSQASPNVASLWWRALAYERGGRLLSDEQSQAWRSLGQLGRTFLRRQVTRAPDLGPADVVGGIELSRITSDGPPNPDWRTGHVLAYQAVALRTPEMLDDQQLIDWLLSAGLSARFLAQLVIDEPAAYSLRSPADALGGVRLAPWNNHLTVSAQAMTLLAILELQASLEHLAERGM